MARRLPPPKRWEYVRVGPSALHGQGLFAARDLPKGTPIIEYVGKRIPKKTGDRLADKEWASGRVYIFELSRRVDLNGNLKSNIARLANFSCEPNAESFNQDSRRIWIRALRDIKDGEEITYDYNFPFREPPPACQCGAKRCRGFMVGEEHVAELHEWMERTAAVRVVKSSRKR